VTLPSTNFAIADGYRESGTPETHDIFRITPVDGETVDESLMGNAQCVRCLVTPGTAVSLTNSAGPGGRLPFRRSTSRQGRTPFANGPLAFHPVATRGLDRRGRCRPGHHLGSRCPAPVTPVAQGLARETAFERVSLTSSAFPAAAPHAGYTEVSRSSELIFRRLLTVEALSGRAALIMMACAWSGPACGEIARRTILL
jgi:hypothetical protein